MDRGGPTAGAGDFPFCVEELLKNHGHIQQGFQNDLNNEAVLKDVLWVILEGQFQILRHPHFTHAITMSFFCGGREFLASGVNMHEFSGRLNCKGTRFFGNASVFL